ncbi:MAG: DUF2815 family protein [Actinomycetaceae bacterium]|nr:DUF2815 family protein [Arcanobacterium sp.]MDD7505576.1 DUF2815 family protein [Actinomycetaceae bacterium]MDY6143805.1 DUF2815 family protein [Arcanobacterium sp.]
MSENMMKPTKVITGKVRCSYAYLLEPRPGNKPDDKPKYSVSLIIPKDDKTTIDRIKKAIAAAIDEGEAKLGLPPKGDPKRKLAIQNLTLPLRDGDTDRFEHEEYANAMFTNANSVRKPGIIDQNKRPLTEPEDVYSGMYARVSLNFYAYAVQGKKGIAAGLGNVQKWADGERLGGGGMSADAEFDVLELDEVEDGDTAYEDLL